MQSYRIPESEEEAAWAMKEMSLEQTASTPLGSKKNHEVNDQPNRAQRRAFQSKMKKRVKQLISKQDKRNAKYRACIKANSSNDGGTPGGGKDDVESYLR